jgi:hypothetical protein
VIFERICCDLLVSMIIPASTLVPNIGFSFFLDSQRAELSEYAQFACLLSRLQELITSAIISLISNFNQNENSNLISECFAPDRWDR